MIEMSPGGQAVVVRPPMDSEIQAPREQDDE